MTTKSAFNRKWLQERRQRLADEMVAMQRDIEHWNRLHPNEEPIVMPFDLTADIEALRNGK
jgi:hypothetical protein